MARCVGVGTRGPAGGGKGEAGPRPRPRQALPAGSCGMALKTPTELFGNTSLPRRTKIKSDL